MFSLYLPLLLFIVAVAARPSPRPEDAASSTPALQPRDPNPPPIVHNPTMSDQMSHTTFVAVIVCSFLFVLLLVLLTLFRKDRYRRLWRWARSRHTQSKGREPPVNVPSRNGHSMNPWQSQFSPSYPPKAFQRT